MALVIALAISSQPIFVPVERPKNENKEPNIPNYGSCGKFHVPSATVLLGEASRARSPKDVEAFVKRLSLFAWKGAPFVRREHHSYVLLHELYDLQGRFQKISNEKLNCLVARIETIFQGDLTRDHFR